MKGQTQSIASLDTLSEYAKEYVAILNPTASKWNEYNRSTRKHIETIVKEFNVEQIRPLMMAVAKAFPIKEADKAFRLFVHWSVRFLIVGGGRGGTLEKVYTDSARGVTRGEIMTAKELEKRIVPEIPTDHQFEAAFAAATVSG